MLLATREQRKGGLKFPRAGPFGPFGRQKDMKERLEENASEHLRLRTVVEYNGERKRLILYTPQTLQVSRKLFTSTYKQKKRTGLQTDAYIEIQIFNLRRLEPNPCPCGHGLLGY